MKKILYNSLVFSFLIAIPSFLILSGCTDKGSPSLYQGIPSGPVGATPAISSISPSYGLAGVSTITITGSNFSSNNSNNLVYFNGIIGNVINSTPTQIKVIAPGSVIGDSVKVKVATVNAELFSNTLYYILTPASKDFYPGPNDQTDVPFSIISDNLGNMYSSNIAIGVEKITPDSVSTLYSPKGGETFWTCMRFGTGGVMYAVRGLQALFTIPAGGGVKNSTYVVLSPASIKISQIEFDPLGNLWAAGKNTAIYRINPDKTYTSFPFSANVTAMRVYIDGGTTYLYVAAQQDSLTIIERMPIDASGNLGAAETYFDFSGAYGANFTVNAIEIAADGELFLATNLPHPIVYVNTDKSTDYLYPALLSSSPALSLAWGTGSFLYYIRKQVNDASGAFVTPQTIVRLDVQKQGAPYYGQ